MAQACASTFVLFLVLGIRTFLAQQSGSSSPPACPGSDPGLLGFVKLPAGTDYPGNDVQYFPQMPTAACLSACLGISTHDCRMVTVTPAGECWLKNAVGPTSAVNRNVQGYALPCNLQDPCGQSLCNQTVGPTSVQCQCVNASELGYRAAAPFNAFFAGYDTTWGGSFTAPGSLQCTEECNSRNTECVLAQFSPGNGRCRLKHTFNSSSFISDPEVQAFVNFCADNNGFCGAQACAVGPPQECVDPSFYGFEYVESNVDYQGSIIISYPNLDSATCIQACANNSACQFVNSAPASLFCTLEANATTPIASPGTLVFARQGYKLN